MAATLCALIRAAQLTLNVSTREDQVRAAYKSLLVTTVASNRLFTTDGPPTFGIKQPIAIAATNAAAEAILRCGANVRFASKTTPRYFTALFNSITWFPLRILGIQNAHFLVNITALDFAWAS